MPGPSRARGALRAVAGHPPLTAALAPAPHTRATTAQVLEGTFKLETPPVMLGYVQPSDRPPCISLFMSLRPRLAPPAGIPEDVISGEAEEITRHATG
jgi:hypothetical protein